jgi:hypothetical protein
MDTTSINIWLGIIAVATLSQAVVIVVGGLLLLRRVQKAEAALDAWVRDVTPLIARVRLALDDLADLSARIRRADDQLSATLDKVSLGVDHAKTAVVARLWPAVGLVRGVAAAWRTIRSRRPARSDRQDALAIARFVNEGGSHG